MTLPGKGASGFCTPSIGPSRELSSPPTSRSRAVSLSTRVPELISIVPLECSGLIIHEPVTIPPQAVNDRPRTRSRKIRAINCPCKTAIVTQSRTAPFRRYPSSLARTSMMPEGNATQDAAIPQRFTLSRITRCKTATAPVPPVSVSATLPLTATADAGTAERNWAPRVPVRTPPGRQPPAASEDDSAPPAE